MIASAVNDTCE